MLYRWRDGTGLFSTSTQQSLHLEISAGDFWECTHFQDATRSRTPMEEERCPHCEYSLKRTLTNLIQSWGSRVLHRQTCRRQALHSFCPSTIRKKAPRWMLPGTTYRERNNPPPLKSLPPTDANLALHVQRAHLQMLLWKSDPPDIQLTDYGWEVKEHEHVMPAVYREPAAPSKLMDVISCSCKAEGKACSGRSSCGSSGLSCTSYCVCEGGNNCCNPHTQQEEDEDEPQQSDVDSDDLVGEESDWLSLWPSILVVLSDIQWLIFDVYLIVVIFLC